MTLPSGKYMHDDVQYFPAGPEFPWANTQAATQRARMRAMGIEPPPPPVYGQAPAAGAINPIQNQFGRPTDINVSPLDNIPQLPPGGGPAPQPPAPGINAPGGNLMPPGNAAPPPPAPARRTGPAAPAARRSAGPRARSASALSLDERLPWLIALRRPPTQPSPTRGRAKNHPLPPCGGGSRWGGDATKVSEGKPRLAATPRKCGTGRSRSGPGRSERKLAAPRLQA